ncbi:MAG TPA: glutaredoxin family protein [Gallionella sp.]
MKRIILLLACLAIMIAQVQAGELFRWVDQSGKVYYGDTPPANAINVESKNFSGNSSRNNDLPYESRIAQQNFPVTLYVGSVCDEVCDQAHSLLNRRGIPFNEKVLKTKKDIEAFKQLSGMEGFVPVLQVGKTFIKGFLESQWNSELDIAGYAKTASYRQRLLQQAPSNPEAPAIPAGEGQTNPAEPAAQ